MQEEVENRTLTLIVSGTKFTGRLFKAAISKYMAWPTAGRKSWKNSAAGIPPSPPRANRR